MDLSRRELLTAGALVMASPKAALAAAGCAPPTVKKGKRKGKFVQKTNPAARTEIRGDAAVTLKLGPKPKNKKK